LSLHDPNPIKSIYSETQVIDRKTHSKLGNHTGSLVLEHPPSRIREIGHEGVVVKRHHQHLSMSISLTNPHEPGVVKPGQNAQEAIGKTLMTTWTLDLPPSAKMIHKMY
jgi:hypothetical protein